MKKKSYKIVCGEGNHRSFTAALAEIILINKYKNLPDNFYSKNLYRDEFVSLIKICGKLAKKFGRDNFAYFIYKQPDFNFQEDLGLIIWKLQKFDFKNSDLANYNLETILDILKTKLRPPERLLGIDMPETKIVVNKNQQNMFDVLGDL